jgi:hypothetical protein
LAERADRTRAQLYLRGRPPSVINNRIEAALDDRFLESGGA